jgi:argininosuccinate synthase
MSRFLTTLPRSEGVGLAFSGGPDTSAEDAWMRSNGIDIRGDGSGYKVKDIERLYCYAVVVGPGIRTYKPWRALCFVEKLGGRAEMGIFLIEPGMPYGDSPEMAYSTDANIWGATREAKSQRSLSATVETVSYTDRVAHWDPSLEVASEEVSLSLFDGWPIPTNGVTFGSDVDLVLEANRVCRRHGLGVSEQIENRIIEAKSRLIYDALGQVLLRVAYRRLVEAVHNGPMLNNHRSTSRRLGRLLHEGRWSEPQSRMLRESLVRWVRSPISGEMTLRRRGDDYSILDTASDNDAYRPERQSMERVEDMAFRPGDRIEQLVLRKLDLEDTGEACRLRADRDAQRTDARRVQGFLGATTWRSELGRSEALGGGMSYSVAEADAYGSLGLRGTTYGVSLSPAMSVFGNLRGKAVLDFGTGTGRTAGLLSDRGASLVVAVDKDENMLRAARRRPAISYLRIGSSLPMHDMSLDSALCANVFSEFDALEQIEAVCREIWRVLRDGSLFVAVVPSAESYHCNYVNYRYVGRTVRQSGAPLACLIKGARPFVVQDYYWSDGDYVNAIVAAGFDVTGTSLPLADIGDGPWLDEVEVAPDMVISCVRRTR